MDQSLTLIINAAEDFDAPTPAAVTDALAFQSAAQALLETAKAEQAPDLIKATAKDISKVHAAAVEYDTTHDAKVARAEQLTYLAAERVDTAWNQAVGDLEPAFAKAFDQTATDFHTALTALAHVDPQTIADDAYNPAYTKVRALGERLSHLSHIRDAYVTRGRKADIGSHIFERMSRTLIIEDFKDTIRQPEHMGQHDPQGFLYWATASTHPRMTIRWQTVSQQYAQPAVAAVVAGREAMAQRAVELEAALLARR